MKELLLSLSQNYLQEFVDDSSKFSHEEIASVLNMLLCHSSGTSWTTEFEHRFAERIGSVHAISCNSGTSGLHAALYAAGVGPGDEVIIPALTVIMDAYAVIQLGAIPIFADVNEDTHLISVEDISHKISKKTKAIITVSWEGLSCDMDPIMQLAKRNNIIVIDDSARTILGSYKGRTTGTIADITVFSFEAKKHLTCGGEGGMIVTDNPDLAEAARKFAGIGYKHLTADAGRTHLAIESVQDPAYKRFDLIGLNYRMNDVSAAVGIGQLERIDEIVGRRKKIGKMFLDNTTSFDWFIPQKTPVGYEHAYYTFSVDYRGHEYLNVSWKEFYQQYKKLGGDGFYACVAIPYLEPSLHGKVFGNYTMKEGLCPVSESLQKRVMCFKTNYRDLSVAEHQVKLLSNLLKSF